MRKREDGGVREKEWECVYEKVCMQYVTIII